MREVIEWVALSIEVLAVLVIVGAIVLAIIPDGGARISTERSGMFSNYKRRMARGLLLGLELLLAADIVGTIALPPTLERLAALGLLALIRSFLSWSLAVEIDGCWPWRMRSETRAIEVEADEARRTSVKE